MVKDVVCNGVITHEAGTACVPIKCSLMSDESSFGEGILVNTLSMEVEGVYVTIDVNPILNFFKEAENANKNSTN